MRAPTIAPVAVVAVSFLVPGIAAAQSGMCPCPMHGMDGPWFAIATILVIALVLAGIGALVALSVFLVRRSRPGSPAT